MRIDFGMVLGIALEFIFFLYYAGTLFYEKKKKWQCYLIIAANYLVHLLICTLGNGTLNTIVFILINFTCLFFCYHTSIKTAIFQSFLLTILSVASELLIIFIPYFEIYPNNSITMSSIQSMMLTLASKSLYLIELSIVIKCFFKNKQHSGAPSFVPILIPSLTITVLILIGKTNLASNLLSIVCLLLMFINCVFLFINKLIAEKDSELAELKSEHNKHSITFEEYSLLKEKNELSRIFKHNFKEFINTIPTLIKNDPDKAIEFMEEIYKEATATEIFNYSDNIMLNIILTKKIDECAKKGVSLHIENITSKMSFLTSSDTVSLFSNLINNAMESCVNSEKKEIYLNISRYNETFILISVENSADKKPIVINGHLRTHKANKNLHGIGMNSIKRTATKYNGLLSWYYYEEEKTFSTKILFKKPTNTTTETVY